MSLAAGIDRGGEAAVAGTESAVHRVAVDAGEAPFDDAVGVEDNA